MKSLVRIGQVLRRRSKSVLPRAAASFPTRRRVIPRALLVSVVALVIVVALLSTAHVRPHAALRTACVRTRAFLRRLLHRGRNARASLTLDPALMASVFDHVYVVTMRGCEHRAEIVEGYARAVGLNAYRFVGSNFREIDLANPPIPIRNVPDGNLVKAGQVGCTATHNSVWQDVINKNYSRALVLEDDVFLTSDTLAMLPEIIQNIDDASRTRRTPWHYVYFRRSPLRRTSSEPFWAESPSGHPITRAGPSWGTACYAISRAGARYLREKVNFYRQPLDVQISDMQKSEPGFVALSACYNDDFRRLCSENVFELTKEQKGKCSGSATQAGQRLPASAFPKTDY